LGGKKGIWPVKNWWGAGVVIRLGVCVSDNYRHFDSLMWHDLGVGLQQKRSRVRFPAVPLSGNNLGQVVHTPVPLSPSSIIWYRSMGGDALGR